MTLPFKPGLTVTSDRASLPGVKMLFLILCFLFLVQGGTIQVYVKTGENLTLDLTRVHVPKEFEMLKLLKNSSSVLGTFSPGGEPNMTSRTVFSSAKSVTLKNLQKSDSGEFSIKVTGNKDYTLPTYYTVTVQDPVSPVSLKVSSSSSNKCTVICSTEDFNISSTFICENQSCHQERGERSEVTNTGASLSIYLNNSSIICNHSNEVSFTQNKTSIQSCFQFEGEDGQESVKRPIVRTHLFVIAPVAAVAAALLYILWAMLKLSPTTTSPSKMPLFQGDQNV